MAKNAKQFEMSYEVPSVEELHRLAIKKYGEPKEIGEAWKTANDIARDYRIDDQAIITKIYDKFFEGETVLAEANARNIAKRKSEKQRAIDLATFRAERKKAYENTDEGKFRKKLIDVLNQSGESESVYEWDVIVEWALQINEERKRTNQAVGLLIDAFYNGHPRVTKTPELNSDLAKAIANLKNVFP